MPELNIKSFDNNFRDALDLFNNQKWYEAHDAFEDIWNTLNGDKRQIIQGLLQVSVSQFHLQRGNLNGATILLGEGLGRLKGRTHIDLGIDLDSFCRCLEELLIKLQTKQNLDEIDKPLIKLKDTK